MRKLWGVCVVASLVALSACINQETKVADTGAPPEAAPKSEPAAAAKAEPAAPAADATTAQKTSEKPPAEKATSANQAAAAAAPAPAQTQTATVTKPETAQAPAAVPAAKKLATVGSANQQFTNDKGIAIIKESEGLKLAAYQYAGQWLIGYGHSATAKPGMTITEAQAEDLLRQDLGVCEKAIADAVTVPVSSNEFSAMASLCYNIGWQNFAASSVVRRLNAGDRQGAADAFLMWTKGTVNGERVSLPHLEVRRQREKELFLSAGESA